MWTVWPLVGSLLCAAAAAAAAAAEAPSPSTLQGSSSQWRNSTHDSTTNPLSICVRAEAAPGKVHVTVEDVNGKQMSTSTLNVTDTAPHTLTLSWACIRYETCSVTTTLGETKTKGDHVGFGDFGHFLIDFGPGTSWSPVDCDHRTPPSTQEPVTTHDTITTTVDETTVNSETTTAATEPPENDRDTSAAPDGVFDFQTPKEVTSLAPAGTSDSYSEETDLTHNPTTVSDDEETVTSSTTSNGIHQSRGPSSGGGLSSVGKVTVGLMVVTLVMGAIVAVVYRQSVRRAVFTLQQRALQLVRPAQVTPV